MTFSLMRVGIRRMLDPPSPHSPRAVGEAGELSVQKYLAKQGIRTERGHFMDPNTGALTKTPSDSQNFVQLDLYAQKMNVVYDSKVGYRTISVLSKNEIVRQSTLLKNGFLSAYFWISMPNFAGAAGFSGPLKAYLNASQIGYIQIESD
jgi:hypothetical protein